MAAPRRSTRQKVRPDRLVEQEHIGSRARDTPNPWIRKRVVTQKMAQRAKCEFLGGVAPNAPPGDSPVPGAPGNLKLHVEWIYQNLCYFFTAVEAFQHAGLNPGPRGTFPPPPAHIHPAPAAIINALRDPRAIPTLEESWEALWESLYSFLGFPMRAGAKLPTAMSTIKDGLGGNELPDTIRGIPNLWRNMKPLKTMEVCCSLLEQLLGSPDRLQANIAGKTVPGIAAVILEHFEFQLAAAESANASGVDLQGAGFVAHHHAPHIPLGFVIGTGAEFIPGAAPNTEIEHALSFLLIAAHELSGACIGYFEGRLSGSQPSVVTVIRGSTRGSEVGRNIAYDVGGSAMADIASVTGREAGSNAAKARGFVV